MPPMPAGRSVTPQRAGEAYRRSAAYARVGTHPTPVFPGNDEPPDSYGAARRASRFAVILATWFLVAVPFG